jgi:hypothetical protein
VNGNKFPDGDFVRFLHNFFHRRTSGPEEWRQWRQIEIFGIRADDHMGVNDHMGADPCSFANRDIFTDN